MAFYILFSLIVFGVAAQYARSRKFGAERHWTNQTAGEKILLSVVLASVIQFAFFLPGWAVGVSIVGYKDARATALDEFLFGIVALTANTLVYAPVVYLVLSYVFKFYQKISALR